jgi:hypothetical protein
MKSRTIVQKLVHENEFCFFVRSQRGRIVVPLGVRHMTAQRSDASLRNTCTHYPTFRNYNSRCLYMCLYASGALSAQR